MSTRKIGARIGAIRDTDEENVYLFGFGVYQGDEVPYSAGGAWGEILCRQRMLNPKLVLDDGNVVWGCECWWATEERVKEMVGSRKIVFVSIHEAREKAKENGTDR